MLHGLPWFHRDYGTNTTTDYIELRVCGDDGGEDSPVIAFMRFMLSDSSVALFYFLLPYLSCVYMLIYVVSLFY